jgi:hypothetical protein
MNLRYFMLPLFFLAASCSEQKASQQVEGSTEPAASTTVMSDSSSVPVPSEEPSEEVLRKLEFQVYEQIKDAGGMSATATATGESVTLRPTLYEVRKEKCTPTPQTAPGWYNCDQIVKLSLSADGSDPSEQGARISVKWSPKGEWVLQ